MKPAFQQNFAFDPINVTSHYTSRVNFADKSLKFPLSPPPETLELKEWQASDCVTRSG